MAFEADLLRMLEPAVRPAGSPGCAKVARPPIDRQSFDEMMLDARRNQPVQLSAHAGDRLAEMGIELSDEQLRALDDAIGRAADKGARDALMLMNQMGLIVNVPNRTVVTALDADHMRDGVVTQIDSAVFVNETNTEV